MTTGERLIRTTQLKGCFRDAHERRAYMRTLAVAMRIVDDPSLLDRGRAYLDRFVRDDPRQTWAYQLWMETLRLEPVEIARRLVADDERGSRLRDSAPVFVVISKDEAKKIWADAQ